MYKEYIGFKVADNSRANLAPDASHESNCFFRCVEADFETMEQRMESILEQKNRMGFGEVNSSMDNRKRQSIGLTPSTTRINLSVCGDNWYKPNFFIIGAPKCGTTSLSVYLDDHPRICMSDPKEPYFFNTDMKYQGVKKLEHYARCFSAAKKEHVAIGEASTSYLYSESALPAILKFNPIAKFIVLVRNPVDLVYSLHSELLYNGNENIVSFVKAWRLQEERAKGLFIPRSCHEPFWLQYKQVGMLGKRLEWVYKTVGRKRAHVIVMDDMQQNMPDVYAGILEFLGVAHDGRRKFPVLNESKVPHSKILRDVIKSAVEFKNKLGFPPLHIGLIKFLGNLNSKKHVRLALPPEFRQQLNREFRSDIEKLSELLGRDLTYWSHKS